MKNIRHFYSLWFGLLIAFSPCALAVELPLQPGVEAILRKAPANANVGIIVQAVESGKILYQHNADNLFTPASVNKLFVAIAGLAFLKSNYQFETRLRYTGNIKDGILNGDLYIQFTGDPSLKRWHLSGLLNELKAQGISKLNGNIYIDNSTYGLASYAPGWLIHDLSFDFAAPINAIIINENRFGLTVTPTNRNGQPGIIHTSLPDDVVQVQNNTITSARYRQDCPLEVHSDDNNNYKIGGCLPKIHGQQYFALALRDPVPYAKILITNFLKKNQIYFNGDIQLQVTPLNAGTLAVHMSAPLSQLIKAMLKESDNLYTNSLLKQIGAVYYHTQGTWENGLKAIKEILAKPANIDFSQTHLSDGAGLSRLNLVTPRQLAKLLHYAYQQPLVEPDLWIALPIAGKDGTLGGRLGTIAKGEPIHAKTGTMKGISALAGYMKTRHNGLIVFVIMTNGLEDPLHLYKRMEDKICRFLIIAR